MFNFDIADDGNGGFPLLVDGLAPPRGCDIEADLFFGVASAGLLLFKLSPLELSFGEELFDSLSFLANFGLILGVSSLSPTKSSSSASSSIILALEFLLNKLNPLLDLPADFLLSLGDFSLDFLPLLSESLLAVTTGSAVILCKSSTSTFSA